jgi:cytochrome c-type biogenesis protein
MNEVSYPIAFAAGVASFLSPCVLPLFPSYLSFITGASFEDLTGAADTSATDRARIRRLTMNNSLAFILGFSCIFMALGASSSAIGGFLLEYKDSIRVAGGALIIVFGLFFAEVFKLDFLMREKKFHLSGKPAGYAGTFLVGMTFAAGWTPCIGPILATILLYASSKGSTIFGLKLLGVYSMGLAVPFFLSSLALNSFLVYSKKVHRYMRVIMIASGVLLIIFGVLLVTNRLNVLSGLLPDIGIKI